MKKTILYIGGFELPDKNAAALRVIANSKAIEILGLKVVLIGFDRGFSNYESIIKTRRNISSFDSYSLPYPDNVMEWAKYLMNYKPYYEVMHSIPNLSGVVLYNFPAYLSIKIRSLCKKKNIKCYADVTEWYSAMNGSFFYRLIKNLDTFLRIRIVNKSMDGLIVISEFLKKYYKNHQCVILIPPLTDYCTHNHDIVSKKIRKHLRLVYAGVPEKKDCLDLLIKGVSLSSRPFVLDIIGISKEQFLNLHPELSVLLTRNIIFHGRVNHSEVLRVLHEADFSVFFRHNTRMVKAGFPTKFVEALSNGIPVITNNVSDLERYMISKNGVLIETISTDAIAEVIDTVNGSFLVETDLFFYEKYVDCFKFLFEGECV